MTTKCTRCGADMDGKVFACGLCWEAFRAAGCSYAGYEQTTRLFAAWAAANPVAPERRYRIAYAAHPDCGPAFYNGQTFTRTEADVVCRGRYSDGSPTYVAVEVKPKRWVAKDGDAVVTSRFKTKEAAEAWVEARRAEFTVEEVDGE